MKVLKCEKCGKMLGVMTDSPCPTFCCGEPMTVLEVGVTDGAHEKHVPKVTVEGKNVRVDVGDVAHPMLEAHYIEWIALESREGMQRKTLKPGEAPVAFFVLSENDEPVAAYEYCNLHGLWKKEI